VAVAKSRWTGDDPDCAAVHALQPSGALHRTQVATNGFLRYAQSVRDVDNIDAPFGGQQVSDRLVASRSRCALDGHYRPRIVRRANVTGTPLEALTESLQKIFESLL
jgi:hypothetical protein